MKFCKILRIYCSHSNSASALRSFCEELAQKSLLQEVYPTCPTSNEVFQRANALPDVLYAGFDPTTSSLHVGNLLIITSLIKSALNGCKPILLIGGGTAFVGDPSGRETERKQLKQEEVEENSRAIAAQLCGIFKNASEIYHQSILFELLNNNDWFKNMNVLEFLTKSRMHRVGTMLRLGPIKERMKKHQGISYTEFSYQILQAFDWYHLAEKHNCFTQIGGTDQLGNFEAGYKFVRDTMNRQTLSLCLPLLADRSGNKLGKSTHNTKASSSNIWLSKHKTSIMDFFQFFRQLHDDEAEIILRHLSLKKSAEIDQIVSDHKTHIGNWIAQKKLAEEMTALLHGPNQIPLIKKYSEILYQKKLHSVELMQHSIEIDELYELFAGSSLTTLSRISVKTVGQLANILGEGSEGLQTVTSGAFRINGKKLNTPDARLNFDEIILARNKPVSFVNWGKRNFRLIHWID